METYDVVVIGAGPGGLAAAKGAKDCGASRVVVLERNREIGGILNQCIHDGFGLIRYKDLLVGPEYAQRAIKEAEERHVDIFTEYHVAKITEDKVITAYSKKGIKEFKAKAIVLATGCRERTRGNISTPGSRPSGIFTAGVAQHLINIQNVMIGKRVVIVGSGDIGLIMARRLTLEGAKVLAVTEIMSEPTGLSRNISQCLYEFKIPLYVKTAVSRIIGEKRIEAVELSDLDDRGEIIPNTARCIECDTLVLSVGLIPENELANTVGIKLLDNNGVETDAFLQTSVDGIFSCGNSRQVMDLADYVSEQGEIAGHNAAHYIYKEDMERWDESRTNCMKKGFPEENTITCTLCPNGCQVKFNEKENSYVGNKCPRGRVFAEQEKINPKRVVTTSVKSLGEKPLVSVRTKIPVSRGCIFNLIKTLNGVVISNTVRQNEIITEFYDGETLVPIIATTSAK